MRMTRVVLLDDDPFMLRVLTLQLSQLGYSDVVAFGAGEDALERARDTHAPVDLIFLDINMPGMDGVEFLRRLAGCQFNGSVVVVSGESDRLLESVDRLLKVHKLNALGYLRKPVKLKDLMGVMVRLRPNAGCEKAAGPAKAYSVERFRGALTDGELVNFYQPKVALGTGEVVGVECLVRWQHPVDGLVFPDRFIELAATHGLLTALTRAVLPTAMRQAKFWRQAGFELPVAVNVSMDDLTELDFPDHAAATASACGIDPALITLEVTEGQVMKDLSAVLEVLSRLRLKRFRLAMDDFGTGHSSLVQLRDLPFDELKIDGSFVRGACEDGTRQAICSASLRMAHQLNMQVVAEGIEARAEWDLLQQLGCEMGQGYFIARPMPAEDVAGWIKSWETRVRSSSPMSA
jgi:EAL domain-containing protein (putative c-di-GMP-specific phosphodiesterase class I)/FixJ family two-component response regulator